MNEKGYVFSLSVVGGLITAYFDKYGIIFIFVGIAIVFDIVTGMVRSAANGIPITSKKARVGFWKKVTLLLALFLGIFMDAFLPQLVLTIGARIPFSLPFGMIIGCYIVLNELISICENIYGVNALSMPKWVVKLLKGYKKNIDDLTKEDKTNE